MYPDPYKGEKHKSSKKLDGHRPEYDADNREPEVKSKYKNFKGDPID
ncbi:hypothetical protein [Clostridium oceanicum]|uniref:Uncharacterized protein n=1 Tax=Clostridium oceanicum TaxID=1543 RepID=A0ABN1JVR2_9CLOT